MRAAAHRNRRTGEPAPSTAPASCAREHDVLAALHLLDDDDRRARMGSAMKALAKPGAAATIVDWCQAQASQKQQKKAR